MLVEKIDALRKEVEALTASNAEEIEALRLKYLSKKGELNALMADFRNVAADQKNSSSSLSIRSTDSRNRWQQQRLLPMTSTLPVLPTLSSLAHATLSL